MTIGAGRNLKVRGHFAPDKFFYCAPHFSGVPLTGGGTAQTREGTLVVVVCYGIVGFNVPLNTLFGDDLRVSEI